MIRQPNISVCMPTYNQGRYIRQALDSVLRQTKQDFEIIVYDDASTDDSRRVIDGFSGKVAAYFRPKSHQLGSHMFGFEQSTGDVIIFLDADDLLEPHVMLEIAKVWRSGTPKFSAG